MRLWSILDDSEHLQNVRKFDVSRWPLWICFAAQRYSQNPVHKLKDVFDRYLYAKIRRPHQAVERVRFQPTIVWQQTTNNKQTKQRILLSNFGAYNLTSKLRLSDQSFCVPRILESSISGLEGTLTLLISPQTLKNKYLNHQCIYWQLDHINVNMNDPYIDSNV